MHRNWDTLENILQLSPHTCRYTYEQPRLNWDFNRNIKRGVEFVFDLETYLFDALDPVSRVVFRDYYEDFRLTHSLLKKGDYRDLERYSIIPHSLGSLLHYNVRSSARNRNSLPRSRRLNHGHSLITSQR
jgi:hypothetical protein